MRQPRSPYDFLQPRHAAARIERHVEAVLPRLVDTFCRLYATEAGDVEISEIRLDTFSYLFDHVRERVVAAYGTTTGRKHERRDKHRQRTYPPMRVPGDDKGHAIAHSAGGGLDINVFPQRKDLNRGVFKQLEKLAVEHPGSFYFVRMIYDDDGDRPKKIEQGLIVNDPERPRFEYRVFDN